MNKAINAILIVAMVLTAVVIANGFDKELENHEKTQQRYAEYMQNEQSRN